LELEKKSFGKSTRGDAWRVKRLDKGEGMFDLRKRGVGCSGNFREVGLKETVFVQVSDNFGSCGVGGGVGLGEGEL